MDRLDKLKQVLEVMKDDTVKPSTLKQFLELVLGVIKKSKDELSRLSADNLTTIQNAIDYMEVEHTKMMADVSQETSSVKNEMMVKMESSIKEMRAMCEEMMLAKPADGKDADEEIIVDKVLSKIEFPKPIIETPEQIRDKLESLEKENRLDASAIKNLPEFTKHIVGGVVARNLYQLGDVSLTSLMDGDNLVWDNTNKFWKNATSPGGTPTLTSTQIAFGDGSNLMTSSSSFTWNDTTKVLTTGGVIGEVDPAYYSGGTNAGYTMYPYPAGSSFSTSPDYHMRTSSLAASAGDTSARIFASQVYGLIFRTRDLALGALSHWMALSKGSTGGLAVKQYDFAASFDTSGTPTLNGSLTSASTGVRAWVLPDQSGTIALTSDITTPFLTATQIAFGDVSNAMTSSANLTWADSSGIMTLGGSSPSIITADSNSAKDLQLIAGSAVSGINNGANVYIASGEGFGGGTNGNLLLDNGDNLYSFVGGGAWGVLDFSLVNTSDKTFTFPNTSGTLALVGDLAGYVPYVNATTHVDLTGAGNYSITAWNVAAKNSFYFPLSDLLMWATAAITDTDNAYTFADGFGTTYRQIKARSLLLKGTSAGTTQFYVGSTGTIEIGSFNTFDPVSAGAYRTALAISGNTNTHFGYSGSTNQTSALRNSTFGVNAGFAITSGTDNVAFGYQALVQLTDGTGNSAFGTNALFSIAGGSISNNSAFGFNAGYSTVLGYDNVYFGLQAGYWNVNGTRNTYVGRNSGLFNLGSGNIVFGYNSGLASSGTIDYSLAIGYEAYNTANNQVVIGGNTGNYYNDFYFGSGVTYTSPVGFTLNATGGSGTNIAGASLTLAGGKATGNAAGGDIIFKTSDAGGSGTTLQSLTEKMRLTVDGTLKIVTKLGILESTGATYYTYFQGGNQSADLTYTLPTAYPAVSGYVLSSTDAGVMSWVAAATGSIGGSTGSTDNAALRADGVGGSTLQASPLIIGDVTSKNAILDFSLLATSDKTFTFPNTTGTFALLSDIPVVTNFATKALDNLASVAINAALIPGTAGALDFGSTSKPWADIWMAGSSGTPGTNQFRITGASTSGVRTITLPNASGTVMLLPAAPADYTVSNVTTDRAYDANVTSIDELADVLGTLIADLTTLGLLQ